MEHQDNPEDIVEPNKKNSSDSNSHHFLKKIGDGYISENSESLFNTNEFDSPLTPMTPQTDRVEQPKANLQKLKTNNTYSFQTPSPMINVDLDSQFSGMEKVESVYNSKSNMKFSGVSDEN